MMTKAQEIIEIFELFLEGKGVEIPNGERCGDEGEAIIYGTDYGYLEEVISSILGEIDDAYL